MDLKGHYHCHGCSVCPQTIEGSTLVTSNRFTNNLKQHTDCASKEIIYVIIYKCNKMYIGASRRSIMLRICEHWSKIRHKIMEAAMVAYFVE